MKKEGGKAVYAPGIWPLMLMGVIALLGIVAFNSGSKKGGIERERLALVWTDLGQLSRGEQMALRRASASCGLTQDTRAATRAGVVDCLARGASMEDRETIELLLERANAPAAGGAAE